MKHVVIALLFAATSMPQALCQRGQRPSGGSPEAQARHKDSRGRLGYSITSFPARTAVVGLPYSYQVAVTSNCGGNPAPTLTLAEGPPGAELSPGGLLSWLPGPGDAGTYTIRIRAASAGMQVCPSAQQVFELDVVELPSDPSSVAPALPADGPTALLDAVSFLFDGTSGIQTGVDPEDIDPLRVAVLRGRVVDRDGAPVPGVRVSALDHGEFGSTLTRTDGRYDLAVNGGSVLTLRFRHGAFLEAQETAPVAWEDYGEMPEVVLVPLDPAVTEIELANVVEMAVASGSPVSDADGERQAVLLVPPGTAAELVFADGSTESLATIRVRATEYTVGDSGPDAMPGTLPPTSGYTYAVELSCDEAILAGAASVEFSRALPFYVENFIGFEVGTSVPLGYYDRERGTWIPARDGRVIRVLSIAGGLAELDLDGSGTPATPAELADLGITAAERTELAHRYGVGQELWRCQVSHFTPWDCNWPYGPPPAAVPPTEVEPDWGDDAPDENNCGDGSIVRHESQTLGERVPVVGTPFQLFYWSDRVPGFTRGRTVRVAASGATVPPGVLGIEVEVRVAGQVARTTLPALANQSYEYVWDGVDAYGRQTMGGAAATVRLGYTYEAFYYASRTDWEQSFSSSSGTVTGERARSRITLWKDYRSDRSFARSALGSYDQRALGLGGWSLDVLHRYDPRQRALHLGSGGTISASSVPNPVAATIAGTGEFGGDGDGGPGRLATISSVHGLDVAADGSVYFADMENCRVRRIGTDGIVSTVAGDGEAGFAGDGGPATGARLFFPSDVACSPDGSLYVVDSGNNRVRRISPGGTITTVAGRSGPAQTSGDGGPAVEARFESPWSIALGADGSFYVGDAADGLIRRVDPTGIIETLAGTTPGHSGDGGPAHLAQFSSIGGLAVARDGSLFVADPRGLFVSGGNRVRRIDPAGLVRTVAGTGTLGFGGDGGLATNAVLGQPRDVDVADDGVLYIVETTGHRIRRVDTTGRIRTLVGTGVPDFSGDGGPVFLTTLNSPGAIAIGPQGEVVIADTGNFRIRRIQSPLPGTSLADLYVPSPDAALVYQFTARGQHVATWSALTSALLHSFQYDAHGRLLAVVDGDGNTTTVERDLGGAPTRIVAPHGQATLLAVDPNGWLDTITRPGGATASASYTADGLLTGFEDANGNAAAIAYDEFGKLTVDAAAGGASQTLTRAPVLRGYRVTNTTSLGRQSSYTASRGLLGESVRSVAYSDGTVETTTTTAGGTETTVFADGSSIVRQSAPDPRFGMTAPYESLAEVRLPSGRKLTTTVTLDVTLADEADPLSIQGSTQARTVNGRTYSQLFDVVSRTFSNTTPELRTSSTTVDGAGRIVVRRYPTLADVELSYDEHGRLSYVTQGSGPAARVTLFGYSASSGLLEEITDAEGRLTRYLRDASGRVVERVLPDGTSLHFAYDDNGNAVAVTPPGKPEHAFAFGPGDQRTLYAPPSAGLPQSATSYAYNSDRQLEGIAHPSGASLDLVYGAQSGQLSTESTPAGTRTYGYDALSGQLVSIACPDGTTVTYAYDGSLITGTTWSGAVSGSVTRAFNDDLNVASIRVNGANPIHYSFDLDELVVGAGSLARTLEPATGFLAGTTLQDVTDSYAYNAFGEVVQYHADANGAPLLAVTYARDRLGRVTQLVETALGTTVAKAFEYDAVGRLARVWHDAVEVASYSYDPNGNRLTRTTASGGQTVATYDDQDRIVTSGSAVFVHDADGAIVSRTDGTEVTGYARDAYGNLLSVTLPSAVVVTYAYDGGDRMVAKRINGVPVQGLLYQDALNPVAELDGSGAVVSRFVYASRRNVPDYVIRGGLEYRLVTDHLGSVRLVVDAQNGAVVQQLDYDEFGVVLLDTNPGFQPFGFAGGLYDRDTGLVRFGARDYDPTLGRWTTKDPILFGGNDSNLYSYCAQDPVNHTDPTGLWLESAIDATSLGLGISSFSGNYSSGNYWAAALDALGVVADGAALALPLVPGGVGLGINACRGASKTNDFFEGTRYTDKVVEQMRRNDHHGFPESVTGFQDSGTVKNVVGGDGVSREMLEIPGSYQGSDGVFEFMKEADGSINHRFFNKNKR